MKQLTIFLLSISTIFSACIMQYEYTFHNDFSGKVRNSIDISINQSVMNDMQDPESPPDNSSMEEIQRTLEEEYKNIAADLQQVQGISNVQYGWIESAYIMVLSYDFEDIEALNNALIVTMKSSNISFNTKESIKFKAKRKKLIITQPPAENDSLSEDKEYEELKKYFEINTSFSFDRQVKTVDNPEAEVSPSGYKVTIKSDLERMSKEDYNGNLTIKLK